MMCASNAYLVWNVGLVGGIDVQPGLRASWEIDVLKNCSAPSGCRLRDLTSVEATCSGDEYAQLSHC